MSSVTVYVNIFLDWIKMLFMKRHCLRLMEEEEEQGEEKEGEQQEEIRREGEDDMEVRRGRGGGE